MHLLSITPDELEHPRSTDTVLVMSTSGLVRCMIRRDWMKPDDGIVWAKAIEPTSRCPIERQRLRLTPPIRHGDFVMIAGQRYQVCVQRHPPAFFTPA